MIQISKSDYMLFLRHPAWIWVKKHDPKKIPPTDENTQAMFDTGHKFEPYAESLFPEGLALGFEDYDEYLTLPERTQDAIDSGAQVIFQPRFVWQDFTCISDIISFVGEKEIDLYEIKSSTSVKIEYEFDLAFQTAVIEGCGYKIRNIFVIHVNNKYVRNGEIEADKLTHIEDVTEAVKGRGEITKEYMSKSLSVVNSKKMPDPDPKFAKLGSKKEWTVIYNNIMGISNTEKIYDDSVLPVIKTKEIQNFIKKLEYPLYFLDYETMSSLVPYFDGHRPYQQVPFQYSLHIQRTPEADLEHTEYIHSENSDPSRPLAEQLIKDIGDKGSVIVWYEGFEKSRNSELGIMMPEYSDAMKSINDRVVDLMIPFKSKLYDDPRCEGSASIKHVLPVLVPSLSYKALDIQEGGSAQRLWMEAVLDETRKDEKDKILKDLFDYCKLDTLAMVEIFNVLKKI